MTNIGTFLFQNAATATGNGELYYTNKVDKVILEITGTAISGTVIFEGLMPSGAYYAIRGTRLSDGSVASQSTALSELWVLDVTSYIAIRARIHAVGTGNITVNSKLVNSNG
jgi:hypothetical protein